MAPFWDRFGTAGYVQNVFFRNFSVVYAQIGFILVNFVTNSAKLWWLIGFWHLQSLDIDFGCSKCEIDSPQMGILARMVAKKHGFYGDFSVVYVRNGFILGA